MRTFLIAAALATGVGLAATAPTLAAPVNGAVIGQAAQANAAVEQVRWWRRHYRYRWYRHRHYRRWWW